MSRACATPNKILGFLLAERGAEPPVLTHPSCHQGVHVQRHRREGKSRSPGSRLERTFRCPTAPPDRFPDPRREPRPKGLQKACGKNCGWTRSTSHQVIGGLSTSIHRALKCPSTVCLRVLLKAETNWDVVFWFPPKGGPGF